MKKIPVNPFPIFGYLGPEYFCDREKEKKELIQAVKNGRNVTLYAPRRIGKTGLIHHVFHYLNGWNCIYIDVQESFSFKDFTNTFLAAVINSVSKNKPLYKRFYDWLLSFRPVLSANPHTGSIDLEIDFKSDIQQKASIKEALHLLDEYGPGVIALDEFQHIGNWDPDSEKIEGWLRAEMQQLKNVRFIFSGSQFHILSEMFNSAKRPFYASTQSLLLNKIDSADYIEFITKHFKNHDFVIQDEEVKTILEWADGNTYNIQLLCNRVFSRTKKKVDPALINESVQEIYAENKLSYYALRNSMSKYQWNVLAGIAIEGKVYKPTGKVFMTKYELGSSAAVLRALEYLTQNELVYQYIDEAGDSFYQIYDIILMRWLQKR